MFSGTTLIFTFGGASFFLLCMGSALNKPVFVATHLPLPMASAYTNLKAFVVVVNCLAFGARSPKKLSSYPARISVYSIFSLS